MKTRCCLKVVTRYKFPLASGYRVIRLVGWSLAMLWVAAAVRPVSAEPHQSPVDVALWEPTKHLLVVSRGTNCLQLLDSTSGKVLDQVDCGRHPMRVRLGPDGKRAYVPCRDAHRVDRFAIESGKLVRLAAIECGDHPVDFVTNATGTAGYVSLAFRGTICEYDLSTGQMKRELKLGRGTGSLALSRDDRFLGVTVASTRGLAVVDLDAWRVKSQQAFMGINFGHLVTSADGQSFYFPWMVYRDNPITIGNIRKGWVLATRIARHPFESTKRREAISLDPPGRAVADPTGLALTSGDDVIIAAGGTHELLVLRNDNLPWKSYGGSDHLPEELQQDGRRFQRIRVGGRPMGIALSKDDRTLFVANALLSAVQVVDLADGTVQQTWAMDDTPPTLERQGEAIFYDAVRSLDQWYSCHSCHQDGGSNFVTMDTMNDGSAFTKKTVLSLYSIHESAPYTWHGWQNDLRAGLRKSVNTTMLGREPTTLELDALEAYVKTLTPPSNPNITSAEALKRGRDLFVGKAGCVECHAGALGTDGQLHDVGLGSSKDRYPTFNTPILRAVFDRPLLLHDGRAESLEELIQGSDHPAKVMSEELTPEQWADLLAYLKSL